MDVEGGSDEQNVGRAEHGEQIGRRGASVRSVSREINFRIRRQWRVRRDRRRGERVGVGDFAAKSCHVLRGVHSCRACTDDSNGRALHVEAHESIDRKVMALWCMHTKMCAD